MIIIRVEIHRKLHITTFNTLSSTRDIKHYQETKKKKNITHKLCNTQSSINMNVITKKPKNRKIQVRA